MYGRGIIRKPKEHRASDPQYGSPVFLLCLSAESRYFSVLLNILKSGNSLFSGAYLYRVLDTVDKYLAVADVTGVKHLLCRLYDIADGNGAYDDIDLYLRKKARLDLNSAVVFRLALQPPGLPAYACRY